jgi:class 3 adenylate cyclase/tetratricopeptide (TPR) repeat protein
MLELIFPMPARATPEAKRAVHLAVDAVPTYPLGVLTCPSCGEENPEHARFCLACGSPLAPAETRRKERKYATALFADLVGSTTLAEREDPEVVQAVVGRAFDRLAEVIQRHEGLLEKFMGDAVLAVFGVPRAHEDDAERAVRAAIEMQAVLSELNRSFADEGKPELAMRIGVDAGEVLVDLERASGPRDRMLTGDAVNTAARLQTAAEPGRVVVGPGVHEVTRETIEYRELPPLELKGKTEPVPAWDALRIRAKQRGERPQLGLGSRLVGRDEELTVLTQTLRRVETEGRPALVTIVGPAGVGKTRLTAELNAHVDTLPGFQYWRSGRCLAYGNTSYSALADAIKAQCEILEDDPSEVAADKVDEAVRELFGDEDAVPGQVRALVGAGEAGSFTREELFDGWRRFLERMAARYPFVLVLEDIHWADAGLLDFIEHAADWAQGPLMIVALARPELFEVRPQWGGGKRNTASIYLDPLSPDEGAAMVDDLLSGSLPEELRARIVERSEGNPLYVEEIVRKLIDDGALRESAAGWALTQAIEDVELPRSIQSLIAARLDGLPEDEKAALQDAAVVGRVFWAGAVARLTGRDPADARAILGRLRVKELVLPNDPPSFSGENEFTFKHVLIRDGAYDSLPKSLRAEKHDHVAAWAEERAGDRAIELAELIATHLRESLRYHDELGSGPAAEEVKRAYEWARTAGTRARALWQHSEAVRWFREGLGLAKRAGVAIEERASLARSYADVCWGAEPHDETARAAQHAFELAEAIGDEAGAGWALTRLGMAHFQLGDDEQVGGFYTRAIERLEPLGDSADLSDALHWFGQYHWRRGRLGQGEPLLRRAMDVAQRADAPLQYAQAAHTLSMLLSHAGNREEGLELVEKSFVLAQEVGDLALLLRAYNNLPATIADQASEFRRAMTLLHEGIELAQRAGSRGNAAWLLGSLGDIALVLGDLEEAEQHQRHALALAEEVTDEPLRGMRMNGVAWAVLLRGNIEEAADLARRSAEILRDNPEPQAEIYVYSLDGEIAQAQGRLEDAVEHYRGGAQLLRRYSLELAPTIFLGLVRTLLELRRRDEAEEYRDLRTIAGSPSGQAVAAVVEGLLAEDPGEAIRSLRTAVEGLEATGERIELANALVDLGRAQQAVGEDPRGSFERARDLMMACDARLWLPTVERELAALEE